MVKVRFPGGQVATISDYKWSCPEDRFFERLINDDPQTVEAINLAICPDPDRARAEMLIGRIGGEIIYADPPGNPKPGVIY